MGEYGVVCFEQLATGDVVSNCNLPEEGYERGRGGCCCVLYGLACEWQIGGEERGSSKLLRSAML